MSRRGKSMETKKQISGCQRIGETEMGSVYLTGTGFFLEWWKWGDEIRQWWWLHNFVTILKTTDFYTLMKFIVCEYISPHKKQQKQSG